MPQSRDSTIELHVKDVLEFLQMHPSAKPTTVARQFSIPRARLLRRLDGITLCPGIPATNTKLSGPEESALCRYIDRLDRINLPTRKVFIRDTANYILQARALHAEQANLLTVGKK
jgi:hypothetical protein